MMTTLVVGASGATGKHLVEQLLAKDQKVKVIVRSTENLHKPWLDNEHITIIQAAVLDLSEDEMAHHIEGCDAVASCLGHNLTLKGVYGKPRQLVTDATKLLCAAIRKKAPKQPVKFVLMNTAGNSNRDLNEPISFKEKMVLGLLRLLLPPHIDNEKASDYLRLSVGQADHAVEWVVIRPDNLINEENTSAYELFPSPTRSALFNPGKTSRINVGHVMASLITDDDLWDKWKGQMPVVYNNEV